MAANDIDFVVDNRGRYWVIDPLTRTRYEVGRPGLGSHTAAIALYGPPKNVDTMLTGWNEGPTAAEFFNRELNVPRNGMEMVVSGQRNDPFTGSKVENPTSITTGDGTTFESIGGEPEGVTGDPDSEGGVGPEEAFLQAQREDARAQAHELLRLYGLEGLEGFIDEMVNADKSSTEIIQELRTTDVYRERFPGMELRDEAGLAPISEAEYIEAERSYRNILRSFGLPEGFYDSSDDFTTFIASDVSPVELETRVTEGVVAARNAPPEVQRALREFYGIANSEGVLAAYFLDPEKSLDSINRELRAAQIAGASTRTTFGELTREQSEGLAALGLSAGEAQEGFTRLVSDKELHSATAGEIGGDTFTEDELLDAQFGGDAELRERIRRQRERRQAAFSGADAGSVQTSQGLTGLRSSST